MISRLIVFISLCFILISFKGDNLVSALQRDGTDYAVFFAVKDYESWDDLRTPIKDAKAIAKVLKDKYNFKTEILENPTKVEIRQKIADLQRKRFKKGDQLLLFFTGHGEFIPSNYNPDQGKGYFIPSDAKKNDPFRESYLYYPDIKPDINDINCQHIMIVIDACFSGSFLQYRNGSDERPGRLSEREQLIQNNSKKRCRKGITSGGLKRTRDGIYHSPFTDKFLTGLNSLGGADQVLTYNELYTNLEGLQNAPRRGYFGDEDSESNFLFIAKKSNINDGTYNRQADYLAWEKAYQTNSLQYFNEYLTEYPNGLFVIKAKNKIIELEDDIDWKIASSLNNKIAYKEYIDTHPSGKYVTQAKNKINPKKNTSSTEGRVINLNRKSKTKKDNFSGNSGTFTDSRDDQTYRWIRMKDGKIWMAENASYKTSNSYCYDNKESNCNQYGRLYIWEAAKNACPEGWRLPTYENLIQLLESLPGGYNYSPNIWRYKDDRRKAYKNLTSGVFSALLCGGSLSSNEFHGLGDEGEYWLATDGGTDFAWYYNFDNGEVYSRRTKPKTTASYCRCVQGLSD